MDGHRFGMLLAGGWGWGIENVTTQRKRERQNNFKSGVNLGMKANGELLEIGNWETFMKKRENFVVRKQRIRQMHVSWANRYVQQIIIGRSSK